MLIFREIFNIEQQIILNNKTLNQADTNRANLSAILKSFSVTSCYYLSCMIVTKPPTSISYNIEVREAERSALSISPRVTPSGTPE